MWLPLLAELIGVPAYALDVVGDVGRSTQTAPIDDRAALSSWLADVLDGLDVERAHLVGASYGGWAALAFAQHAPERVASLTLVEPVLDKLRPMFWLHGIATGVALLLPPRLRRAAARRLHFRALGGADKRVLRLGFLAQSRYRRGLPRFAPVDDDELATLTTRTLVLLGAHSTVHHTRRLAARIARVAPAIDVEVVPDAGHPLPFDEPATVAAHLCRFLGIEHRSPAAGTTG
jgi:pimeloyl-ACP methyl ester carboxylesterase